MGADTPPADAETPPTDAGRPSAGELAPDPDPRGQAEEQLIWHLERDQFVAQTSRPVARAPLCARATTGLWALRVFVIVVSLMVIYTFFEQLH